MVSTKKRKLPKYIFQDKRNNSYELTKRINGEYVYIASSSVLEVIKELKQQCIDVGWDYDEVLKIKKKYPFERAKLENKYNHSKVRNERYIHPYKRGNHTYYMIQKCIDGKREYFGSYRTLAKAIEIRDLLIKNKWNRTRVDLKQYSPGSAKNKMSNDKESYPNVYFNNDTGMWEVRRVMNYKLEVFYISSSLADACEYRDQLDKNGWHKK